MPLNILAIGASRNIGYFAAMRLIDAGATVTFLLRNLPADDTIQRHAANGKAHIVKGDALVKEDVCSGWTKAMEHGNVDVVLFTVGGKPKFHPTRGLLITPENLVTQSLLNVLCTFPQNAVTPRIVTITSMGLTKDSRAELPFLLKPLYALLAVPHLDKVGAERAISHCAGWKWSIGEPSEDIMGAAWLERQNLPALGSLSKNVLVIRPAILTDGDCKTKPDGTPAYRVSEEEIGGWTVSRKDVAHFVSDAILNRWDEFAGKRVNIVY